LRDQAESLRALASHTRRQALSRRGNSTCRVYAVTSGKGGVGKSIFSLNIAITFAAMEERVLLFDADLGLPNLDVLLGITPTFTLQHYLMERIPLEDVLIKGPGGITILPGGSGIYELANLGEREVLRILEDLRRLEFAFDRIIFDTAAGVSSSVIRFSSAADETILVVVAEPTSIVDAYSALKLIWNEFGDAKVKVVVNRAVNQTVAKEAYAALAQVVHRYLHRELELLGIIPDDNQVEATVRAQVPLVLRSPKSPAGSRIRHIAQTLLHGSEGMSRRSQFFDRIFPFIQRK
jgi:flagellar biosynthesis protein FlhG